MKSRADWIQEAAGYIACETYTPLYKKPLTEPWNVLFAETPGQNHHIYWDTQRMHAFMFACGKASFWNIRGDIFSPDDFEPSGYGPRLKELKPLTFPDEKPSNPAQYSFDLAILLHYIIRSRCPRKKSPSENKTIAM